MKRAAKIVVLISAAILLRPAFIPTVNAGDCVTECMQRSGCWSGGMGCANCGFNNSHAMELCNIQCKGKTTAGSYGAIAYSPKDKLWGFTYGKSDKTTAEKLAMQFCVKEGGAKCEIAASFSNTCGAIAADGNVVTWGTDGTKYNAQLRAVAECKKAGGKQCEAQASICSR